MWVHQKYEMSLIVKKLYSIKTNNWSYLTFTNGIQLNQQNLECEWWSMNASSSKICNESNCTKIVFNQSKKNTLTSLLPDMADWIDKTINAVDEVWMWVHQKYVMSQIVWELYSVKTKKSLTSLFSTMVNWINETMNESDEVWRWVHQNYGMSRIVQTFYSIDTKKCTDLSITNDSCSNWQNNECDGWIMKVSTSKLWNE